MKTSLNNINYIERYLKKELDNNERLNFEAAMINDFHLRINVFLQQKIYKLLTLYERKKLKQQTEEFHQQLFSHPDKKVFKESILQLF